MRYVTMRGSRGVCEIEVRKKRVFAKSNSDKLVEATSTANQPNTHVMDKQDRVEPLVIDDNTLNDFEYGLMHHLEKFNSSNKFRKRNRSRNHNDNWDY